ncbi:MAG TPA: carbohydrate ABC transporter permease [Conexibacter sp.]|jgi:raffinose/stachyose/melibiose transport system permease protein|nr:carbohydrate ABC transporter permease [Conexibacter sp.]
MTTAQRETAAASATAPMWDERTEAASHRRRRAIKLLRETARYLILAIATIAALYPVLWMLAVAMKTQPEYAQDPMGLPSHINFDNFSAVLSNPDVLQYFRNSVIVVGAAVPIVTFTAVLAGYALARLWGRGGMVILFIFLFSELVPISIVAIPLLLTIKQLGINSGILRLICVYSVLMMGFAVLLSRAFFRSIPEELREAARLDGCSEFGVFRRIMVPLARSPITLIAVISFIVLWNELFLAVVLLDSAAGRTLPLGLTEFKGRYATNWPTVSAALLLSALPTLILYGAFQGRIANQFSRSTTRE